MRLAIWMAVLAAGEMGVAHAEPGAQRVDFLRQAAALYDDAPDISLCKSGHVSGAQKQQVIDTLNAIRALHGLGPVAYDTSSDDEVMSAALLMAANGKLSHTPPADWRCWSVLGRKAPATAT